MTAAVIASLLLVGVFFLGWRDKRQHYITHTALKLLQPVSERVAVLEAANLRLEGRISDLEHENGRLWLWGRLNYTKVIELGGEPHNLTPV